MLGEGLVIGSGLCPQLGRVHYSELQYCYLHMSHWVGHSSHPLWVCCSDFSLEPVFRVSYYYYFFCVCEFHQVSTAPFPRCQSKLRLFLFLSQVESLQSSALKHPLPSPFSPLVLAPPGRLSVGIRARWPRQVVQQHC